ncbi:recombinase family protein [Amycolatopsis mediterranei]|nr:recombinase family protein [Amycolatopsis mediterranei]UZF76072.1 recombinase family protein [Amycolatopsis mediterranei]
MTEQGNNSHALDAVRKVGRNQTRSGQVPPASKRESGIALIYLRVSTKEQARTGGGAEGYSIPAQREACYAKAQQLGVTVHEEYVDAGESARSADREQLQKLLKDIKTVRPEFVIVHKIDRLARNREDDIAINLMLRKHGVELISCTENIDDTPSGRLLYGLMAEIAQFYSGNLAQEVMKGLVRKAQEGGTPFRAPIGYINRRESRGGAEFSWVELDPARAEIVQWCLNEYATGEWSAADLVFAARAKGLTTRATATKPQGEISINTMYAIFRNPYYMGVVSYQGIHYEGKHQPLIEPETWLRVQDVLAAHGQQGERDRKHRHYLRGTIFCSGCGGRLHYSRNEGNGGVYAYYLCAKKRTRANNCQRPAVRVERIEEGVADLYERLQVPPETVTAIRDAVTAEMAAEQAEARRSLQHATERKRKLDDERQKLLQAHYAGAIPQDLLASEMKRLTRSLVEADAAISAAKVSQEDVEQVLEAALTAAGHCASAYIRATDSIKRQINHGFFEKLYVGEDGSIERHALTEPFASLIQLSEIHPFDAVAESESGITKRDAAFTRPVVGVRMNTLVGAAGFEPATARV